MKETMKRGLAALMALVMCLSLLPVTAFADDHDDHCHDSPTGKHVWSDWYPEPGDEDEEHVRNCTMCGEEDDDKDHRMKDGVCKDCGYSETQEPSTDDGGKTDETDETQKPGTGDGEGDGGKTDETQKPSTGDGEGDGGKTDETQKPDTKPSQGGHTHWLSGWYFNNDDEHYRYCKYLGCDWSETEEHEWKAYGKPWHDWLDGKRYQHEVCPDCGAWRDVEIGDPGTDPKPEPTPEHTHTYGEWTSADDTNHKKTCTGTGCGDVVTEEHKVATKTIAPTCTEKGGEVKYCTVCDAQLSNPSQDKLGHDWGDWAETKAATCTEAGEEERVCKRDESHTETRPIKATGHSYGDDDKCDCGELKPGHEHKYEWTVTKAATCTEEGSKTGTCKCGDTKTETMNALGHTVVTDPEVPATCTEAGKTAGSHCSLCDTVIAEQKEVPAKGHTNGDPAQENVVDATCTAEGSYDEVVYCAVCNVELRREHKTNEKLPHTEGEAVRENEKPATCTAEGSYEEVVYCAVCNVELRRETRTIPMAEHDFKEAWETTTTHHWHVCKDCGAESEPVNHTYNVLESKPATCTEPGYDRKQCTECKHIEKVLNTLSGLGHAWNEGEVTTKPTCTETGVKTYTCTREGCDATKTEVIGANGHHYGAKVAEVAPTCTEAGTKAHDVCRDCGAKFLSGTNPVEDKDLAIPALGHDFKSGEYADVDEADHEAGHTQKCTRCDERSEAEAHTYGEPEIVAATCTEDGSETYTCTACGHVKVDVLEATGHHYGEDHKCEDCGELDPDHEHVDDDHDGKCDECGEDDPNHEHVYTSEVTKQPTSTEPGERTYTCPCGDTYTEEIPATGTIGGDTGDDDTTGGDTGDETTEIDEPDVPLGGDPFADEGDAATDGTVTILDEAVPLAGLITRADIIGYLWQKSGSPDAELSDFADVAADHVWAVAIGWAQDMGIAVADEEGNFRPDEMVLRSTVEIEGELQEFLNRYAVAAGIELDDDELFIVLDGEDDDIIFGEEAQEILDGFFKKLEAALA